MGEERAELRLPVGAWLLLATAYLALGILGFVVLKTAPAPPSVIPGDPAFLVAMVKTVLYFVLVSAAWSTVIVCAIGALAGLGMAIATAVCPQEDA